MSTGINDVSDTAIWVAYYRGLESDHPRPMFRDPLAKLLVGERGEQIASTFTRTGNYTAWAVLTRTVIIDEFIQKAIAEGVDAVINLGAGLDTRPYRMELPSSFPWVEADFPHMIDYKEKILRDHKPHCQLQRVGVDLSDSVARRSFLESAVPGAKKILVLTEGVIPYLTEEQVAGLAADLRAQSRFAFWIGEYFSAQSYRYLKIAARSAALKNAPFRFFPADWDGFFLQHGWARKEAHYYGEIGRRFRRRPPMPWWVPFVLMLMSKERRAQAEKMSGYLLMVPAGQKPAQ